MSGFFACYLGRPDGLGTWRRAVAAHARWAGEPLVTTVREQALPDGRTLDVAWLSARPCPPPGPDGRLIPLQRNGVSLSVAGATGRLRASVPPTSPQHLYYAPVDGGLALSDDLRLFPKLRSCSLDAAGIFGQLQYGVIPAPYTLFREVRRIPGGHEAEFDAQGAVRLRRAPAPAPSAADPGIPANAADPTERVAAAVDRMLVDAPSGTILYFSGGTDSGLLASRLARLGRRDVRLINYSFGSDDPESALAVRMARHLGFDLHVVQYDEAAVATVFERLGRDYAYPFGDLSTLPTNHLVHATLAVAGDAPLVLEGTGADGVFGMAVKFPWWRRVYRMPPLIRRAVATAYAGLGVWRRDSFAERVARFVRKSVVLPLSHAVVAQNGLDGIAYHVPAETREALTAAMRDSVEALAEEPVDRLMALDLAVICAGHSAPKSFDPLRAGGVHAHYPYLDPAIRELGASLAWSVKCAGGEAKAPIKTLLARDVPAGWVYRPKSGFTPPYHKLFASSPLQGFLHDVVLAPANPLLEYIDRRELDGLIARTVPPHSLSDGALDFLWALAFASGWLGQLAPPAGVEA